MSDSAKSPAPGSSAAAVTAKFTERELQLLGWAMQSLKSGPPEIDNEKLAEFAGMTNPRSAGNAWNALKKKLMAPADLNAPPPTPRRRGGRKKKEVDGEDGEATPKKTSRKRTAKESEDGDASPKKKGRPTKATTKAKQETEEEEEESKVKAEPESSDSSDLKPEAEIEEEEV
ncbi:hypothetical protein N0V86_002147 [Didymella sp. IMI 355093]|nr:hypothetical protein N0V86_002147 [Didymella sp. IMI 355093]